MSSNTFARERIAKLDTLSPIVMSSVINEVSFRGTFIVPSSSMPSLPLASVQPLTAYQALVIYFSSRWLNVDALIESTTAGTTGAYSSYINACGCFVKFGSGYHTLVAYVRKVKRDGGVKS